jgi:hypothetical protein
MLHPFLRDRFLGRLRARDISESVLNRLPNIREDVGNIVNNNNTNINNEAINNSHTNTTTIINQENALHTDRIYYRSFLSNYFMNAVREEDVRRLVNEMGFEEGRVRIALRRTQNNVNRAVEYLLNNPEEIDLRDEHNNRNRVIPDFFRSTLIQPNISSNNNRILYFNL